MFASSKSMSWWIVVMKVESFEFCSSQIFNIRYLPFSIQVIFWGEARLLWQYMYLVTKFPVRLLPSILFRWPSWLELASLPPSSSFVYWDTYLIRLVYQLFLLCVLLTLNDFLFFLHSFDVRLNIIRPYCKTHWWALTYFTSDDPDSIKKCALIPIYNKRELHILSLVPLSKHSGWL